MHKTLTAGGGEYPFHIRKCAEYGKFHIVHIAYPQLPEGCFMSASGSACMEAVWSSKTRDMGKYLYETNGSYQNMSVRPQTPGDSCLRAKQTLHFLYILEQSKHITTSQGILYLIFQMEKKLVVVNETERTS